MGCCKCEEFNWDGSAAIVHTNNAGQQFCFLHAPAGEKWKPDGSGQYSINEFNVAVFARIKQAQEESKLANKYHRCDLRGIVFPGDISFTHLGELNPFPRVSFWNCEFHGKADFKFSHFGSSADFWNAKFYSQADFSWVVFSDECDFRLVEFYFDSMFNNTLFKSTAEFGRVLFGSKSDFTSCLSDKNALRMHDLFTFSIKNLHYASMEASNFSFLGCKWPDRLGLDAHSEYSKYSILTCGELYRTMKQKAAENLDQPQVSRWHFREKLMQLKGLLDNKRSNDLLEVVEDRDATLTTRAWAWFKLLALPPYKPKVTLTGLYWATSGFGERAVRAGVWLLALLLLPFIANSPIGHSLWQSWNWMPGASVLSAWAHSIGDSINASAAMQYIPFTKDIPGIGWAKVGQALWQGVILLQFTLFALAVRNRFRR